MVKDLKYLFFCVCSKVSLMEDAEQNIHLRNLSLHQASNEEEALNLLFLGDTNRMIAEVSTVMINLIAFHLFKGNFKISVRVNLLVIQMHPSYSLMNILYAALTWSTEFSRFTALMEGICATLSSHIHAFKNIYLFLYRYLFEGGYFGAIMGSVKIAKIKCL